MFPEIEMLSETFPPPEKLQAKKLYPVVRFNMLKNYRWNQVI